MMPYCPICRNCSIEFERHARRSNAKCPNCGSLERHRHHFVVTQRSDAIKQRLSGSVLHVGARDCEMWIKRGAKLYVSCEIKRNHAMVCGRLEELPFQSNVFNIVWASHVLEHIQEVQAALEEIHRVLVKDGIALLDVPIYGCWTRMLSSPDNQHHYWHPGLDWFNNYSNAGFRVQLEWASKEHARYSLLSDGILAVCGRI